MKMIERDRMILENKHIKETSDETIKKFGQYFTPYKIAKFMRLDS